MHDRAAVIHAIEQASRDGKLTPRQREVVSLHYFADLSTRRIALQLNIAEPTVRDRLARARANLRPYLEAA